MKLSNQTSQATACSRCPLHHDQRRALTDPASWAFLYYSSLVVFSQKIPSSFFFFLPFLYFLITSGEFLIRNHLTPVPTAKREKRQRRSIQVDPLAIISGTKHPRKPEPPYLANAYVVACQLELFFLVIQKNNKEERALPCESQGSCDFRVVFPLLYRSLGRLASRSHPAAAARLITHLDK